jgi:uroporphyrinogen III methyltransferase/synthase
MNELGKEPLKGKSIVITRAKEQARSFSRKLKAFGARVIEFPTIKFAPPEDWSEVDKAISNLSHYDWLIFTSVNGVRFFFARLEEKGLDFSPLREISIAAIGPATAKEIEGRELKVSYIPENYVAESIVKGFKKYELSGKRALLPRAEKARELIPEKLREEGMEVDVVTVYRTLPERKNASEMARMIKNGEVDLITFTSSSTVRNFVEVLKEKLDLKSSLSQVKIACIGPVTAKTARELGLKVDILAEEFTIDGLIKSILNFYQA